jgi:hypothetical protein
VVYRGSVHGLGSLPFILPLVKRKDTSYVFDGKEDLDVVEEPYVAGTQAFLFSGFQRGIMRVLLSLRRLICFQMSICPVPLFVNWTDSILCE